ncbi:MAG: diacylglycerol/lipid kinase family protein [Bradymonadia bacterium]
MSISTFVCINPASAGGRTGQRWPEIAAALRSQVGEFSHGFTEARGEAAGMVAEALAEGHRRIVSVGGDGTHNEVVNGFFDDEGPRAPDAELALVPTGTGGDLRRTLGLPKDHLEAISLIGVSVKAVDVGRVEYVDHHGQPGARWFINVASFGLSGKVVDVVNNSGKLLGGKLSFMLGVARAGLTYKNQSVRIAIDGETTYEGPVNSVAVANAQYFGGGMHIAPDAAMDDGAFDVVNLGDLGTIRSATNMPRLYKGTHVEMDDITVHRGTVVEAWPLGDEQVRLDVDGEQPGMLPAKITLYPKALKLGFAP